MAQRTSINIDDNPALRVIVDKVRENHEPVFVRDAGEDVAIVLPIDTTEQRDDFKPTPEQLAAFRSAFGGWKGLVDAEELKAQIKAARGSNRPTYTL